MTIWCMRIACWITKFTYAHSEYVMLIAFLLMIGNNYCFSTAMTLARTHLNVLLYVYRLSCIQWHTNLLSNKQALFTI